MPHITNAIQDWIERVAKIPVDDTNEQPDVCVIELGGVTGMLFVRKRYCDELNKV